MTDYPCPLCRGTQVIYGWGWETYHDSLDRWEAMLREKPDDEQLQRFMEETRAERPQHDPEFVPCPRCLGKGFLAAPDLCPSHDREDRALATHIVIDDYGPKPGTSRTKREPRLRCYGCAMRSARWHVEHHPDQPLMVFALTPVIADDIPAEEGA